jgi:hypothetical protein
MNNVKQLSISLLREMLATANNTSLFAESKINYLDPALSLHHSSEYSQFMDQKHRCEVKINQIEACITWLKSIENENINTPKTETKSE